MELELTGQVALVTGGGRGIGLATALTLAQRGARIVINDIETDAVDSARTQVEAAHGEVLPCPGDISDPVQVQAMVKAVVARFERLDILVNNAGIGGRSHTLLEITLGEWDRFIKIDLTGVFLCCQAVVPLMMRQGGGKIVNLSSIFGLSGAAGSIPYSAAKAGVIALTQALARELAPHRINVNAVAPGLIDTAMSQSRGTVESMRSHVLWPRIGRPEDVAELIAFLVSTRAEFITGQVISPNGGARTAWMYDDWNKDLTGTDAGNKGYPANGENYPAIFRQQVRLITEAGLHIGAHAVGDRGIDWVVDSYKEALDSTKTQGLRDSIIHANIPTDHAIETMAYLQRAYDAGYPEAQAPFMRWIGDTYAGNFGPARNPRLMPFKTYVKNGILWAGGSDYGVTPYAARYGIWSSIARQTLAATYGPTPFGMTESMDVHTALKSYTIWAARQLFLDPQIGSLEVGKAADIAVWDKNMYEIPTAELKDLKCELTVLAGKIVYQAR